MPSSRENKSRKDRGNRESKMGCLSRRLAERCALLRVLFSYTSQKQKKNWKDNKKTNIERECASRLNQIPCPIVNASKYPPRNQPCCGVVDEENGRFCNGPVKVFPGEEIRDHSENQTHACCDDKGKTKNKKEKEVSCETDAKRGYLSKLDRKHRSRCNKRRDALRSMMVLCRCKYSSNFSPGNVE